MGETAGRDRTFEPTALTAEAPAPLTGGARAMGRSPFPDEAAKHWLLSSIIWLTVVDLFGLVLATEFVTPEAFSHYSWLSFSRVRPSHVNGVILAWLSMMYFGALFYMLPRLVGTRGMWSDRLGVICAWAWNVMYLLGIIGLLTGHSQGREYGEFIWPIDIALLVIWSANIVNILATVAIRTIRPIYVSVWFFIASPLWLAVDYAIGNVIWRPGHVWGAPSGALGNSLSDAMLNWWYAHNLFGLWLTPMLLALTYYIVPRVTNFVVAHAHLALLGAFTTLGMGVIDYIVAQVYAKPLYSRSLSEWQYWLVTVGFTGFFSVLTLAGFQQGFSWQEGIPEVNVLPQLHAYYIARGIFGAMIVLSGIVQVVNIGMTIFTNTAERRRLETLRVAEAIAPPPVAG